MHYGRMDFIDLAPVMGLNVQALRAEVTFVCIIMACAPLLPRALGWLLFV